MSDPLLARALRDAIGKHGAWKLKLKTSVTLGKAIIPAAEAMRDDCCDFGRWLHAPEQKANYGQTVQYRVITRLHREFHQCAGSIMQQVESGNAAKAAQLIDAEFTPQSEHLVRGLNKWVSEAA